MSLLTLLQDNKLEQEVSQIDLNKLFFKEKTFSKKVTSLDSIIVSLEILDTFELTTKNLQVVLCKEYPIKTQSTIFRPIFFFLLTRMLTFARHPHTLRYFRFGSLFFHSS